MMRAPFWPLMITAAGTWLCAIVLTVVLARMTVPPYIRRQFRRMAIAITTLVVVMVAWQMYRISRGIILPGWFYAWLYCGIFAPLQIALFFGASDRETLRRELEQRADTEQSRP
jgi:hypothetical protein